MRTFMRAMPFVLAFSGDRDAEGYRRRMGGRCLRAHNVRFGALE